MLLKRVREELGEDVLSPIFGKIKKIDPTKIVGESLSVRVGESVTVKAENIDHETVGMVTEVSNEYFIVTPFGFIEGFKSGDKIFKNSGGLSIPVSDEVLGRVVDPFMRPIDEKGSIGGKKTQMPIMKQPISAMKRGLIDEPFSVGVKSIDSHLTLGKGQKVGIFAGSGVGKSTLLGMVVRGADAPIKVVALIGERGREIPEFIHKNLGGNLENTVIIVATSDDSALMRKYGAFSAMSVAEYFKSQGRDVLFIMDSVTRFAMAQREIGLSLGEPPTSKGYPPSSMSILPQLMERAGKEEGQGSITAVFTILVEGDDMSDPIADQSRSILDGHIVLSRELTDSGIYPPINILNSASRVMSDVVIPEHQEAVQKFKRYYSLLKENETLIRIGAYQVGTDKELDTAIAKKEAMENLLKQPPYEKISFQETVQTLIQIMS
ncbi:Flagellar biosynthesis protein FliI [Thiovulum sp. ES]|nr:Flagellar biosynthesis protein FliI [Thiovulum sp. ES]